MAQRACDGCGRTYEAKRSTSKFCDPTCRKRGQRAAAAPAPGGLREMLNLGPGPLTAATHAELSAAGRLESSVGRAALMLAARLDTPTSDTGSSIAALVREHRATLESAMRGVKVAGDPLDELRARRDVKRAG